MKWYVIKRLLQIIPVILGVTLIAFTLIHLAPGDPVRTMLGQHATQQQIDETRIKYGLDQPLYVQYFVWLGNVVKGDLGRSILSHEQVTTEIASRFPNTFELAIAAMIFAIIIGVIAGIISATKQYSAADYTVMGVALFGISMPVFWLGIMLMMIFGVILGWMPIGGRIDLLIPFQRITGFMIIDSIITLNGAASSVSFVICYFLPSHSGPFQWRSSREQPGQVCLRFCVRISSEQNAQRVCQNARSFINMRSATQWFRL